MSFRPALSALVVLTPAAPQRADQHRRHSEGIEGDAESEDPKYPFVCLSGHQLK